MSYEDLEKARAERAVKEATTEPKKAAKEAKTSRKRFSLGQYIKLNA